MPMKAKIIVIVAGKCCFSADESDENLYEWGIIRIFAIEELC